MPQSAEQTDWFKRFIDVATLLVIAIGLFFTVDQATKLNKSLELSNQTNNVSTWTTVTGQSIEIDKVFIDNPAFSKYFFSNEKIEKGDPNYDKADAIATVVLDYFDSVMVLLDYTTSATPLIKGHVAGKHGSTHFMDHEAWEAYFKSVFTTSPLLCGRLKQDWPIYGKEMRRLGGSACGISGVNH